MAEKITGACLCGQVKYTCLAAPQFSGNCHCRACQKATGSAYAPEMFFLESDVSLTGELKVFARKADSGKMVWQHFCPNCGTYVCARTEGLPGMLGVLAGTLDNPNDYQPQIDIFTDSASHWDVMHANLPRFAKMPPAA